MIFKPRVLEGLKNRMFQKYFFNFYSWVFKARRFFKVQGCRTARLAKTRQKRRGNPLKKLKLIIKNDFLVRIKIFRVIFNVFLL